MNLLHRFHAWRAASGRLRVLQAAVIVVAVITVIPVGVSTYQHLQQVQQDARARLIRLHRLWELHPEFKGTAETWTRFASRLLTDRQLMFRVNAKYGDLAPQIELDYRRDLTIAQSEVVLGAFALWAVPLLAVYAAGYALQRKPRTRLTPRRESASVRDPRYMPTNATTHNNGGNQ